MKKFWTYLLTCACLTLCTVAIATAQSLTSDKSDYAPGTPATLTGSGFAAGESVTLQVLHADGTPATGTDHEPWTVLVGDDGSFVTTWMVCTDDCVGSLLRATATAGSATASVEFTDGSCTPTSATCPDCVPSLKSGNVPTLTTTAPTVDGVKDDFPGEWSASDLWTHMYTAGSDCKPVLSEAYVKYVCHGATATVYVFVECLSGNFIQVDPSNDGGNNWIKLDCGTAGCVTAGGKFVDSSDQPTTSAAHACSNGHFAYVGQSGNLATGYEASFTIPANATYSIAVHAEVQVGTDPAPNTSAGPNGPQGGICMSLPCQGGCTPTGVPVIDCTPGSNDLGCNPKGGIPACDAGVTASDDCGPVAVTCASSDEVSGCVHTRTITYTATNAVGTSDCVQTITWTVDTEAPVITATGSTLTLGCNPTAEELEAALGTATAADNCGDLIPTPTDGAVVVNGCARSQTRTWNVSDACTNAAEPVSRTVTWTEDETAPVLPTLPAGGGLGCNPTSLPACVTGLKATDNCSGEVDVTCTAGDVSNVGACGKSQTFTYSAVDACGIKASQDVTYTWTVDTEAPVITATGSTLTLGCNPTAEEIEAALGSATASDNCGDLIPTPTDGAVVVNGCARSQTRTWNVSDGCDNAATAVSRTVTWTEDTTPPVAPAAPAAASYQCVGEVPAAGSLTAHDECSGDISATGVDSNNGGKGCVSDPLIITRTWTFKDACNNSSSASQTITVIDNTKPGITCPANVTVNGGGNCCVAASQVNLGTPTTSDNCNGAVTVTNDAPAQFCVGTTTVTWTATDACGNSATCTQTVTVKGQICATKFYDANANGVRDGDEQGVAGWTISLSDGQTGTTDATGKVCFNVAAGIYRVTEGSKASWQATTLTSVPVTIDQDHCSASATFGNFCYSAPSGGVTLGFWTNKNGEKILSNNPGWVALLNGLNCLRNANGTLHTFSNYADLKNWLLNASATNMAYMLSAQLATNVLDEYANGFSGTTSVLVPGGVKTLANVCIVPFLSVTQPITCGSPALLALTALPGSTACGCSSNDGLVTVNGLQDRAVCLLAAYGNTTSTSAQRTYQECVKDILDMINNNGNPTGSSAYPCGGVSKYINPAGTCQ